jgi:hypothetical protein
MCVFLFVRGRYELRLAREDLAEMSRKLSEAQTSAAKPARAEERLQVCLIVVVCACIVQLVTVNCESR